MEITDQNISLDDRVDALEDVMLKNFPVVDCPVVHRFTPGLYIREIFMPAGTYITSLIHNTTHPFFILKGKVEVYSENDGFQILEAPYIGVTTPGTRRVLKIIEDCVWATSHPTDIQPSGDSEKEIQDAVDKVGELIIEKHTNKIVGGVIKNNEVLGLLTG